MTAAPDLGLKVFPRHLGTWEGTYTYLTPDGQLLDRHRCRLSFKLEGNRWHQYNHYEWEDGRVQDIYFPGEFRDGVLYFDTDRIKGHAWESGENTIELTWVYKNNPKVGLIEIITLWDDTHRSRVWQWFNGTTIEKLTVISETKVA
jgi:hypothetical protein